MTDLPTGTVAFLFTDLVSSTRLWEERAAEMSAALALHDRTLRSVIEAAGGYVFSTAGDAFSAAFHSCQDAADAAREIGERLDAIEWPTPEPLAVRIGVHVGVADERDGNYYGPVLNRTARLMSAAHGGQVLITDALKGMLTHADQRFCVDLGQHRLKDLAAPEHVWQFGQGAFPPITSLSAAKHNLPVERTALVGREADVGSIAESVRRNRLVTVLGIGGSGKTRVATAVAAEIAHEQAGGVWFVDLVPARSADDVASSIAAAVGLTLAGDDVLEALGVALRSRETLVVLDNCEHVVDEVADVVDHLLANAAASRFLATSRQPLDLSDEVHVQLEPLAFAGEGRPPAVELFAAGAARVGCTLDESEMADALAICRHLDGHALSLELAAAQLKHLTIAQLRERIGDRFELLARRRGGSRQASLLGVLEDTWEMLDPRERTMLQQLAAFPATFDLDAVEGSCQRLDVGLAVRTLGGLVDRSVVVRSGDDRYALLETVKEFVRRSWPSDAPMVRHERWLLDHLASQSPDARFVDFDLVFWIGRHWDDWRAVEARLVDDGRWGELGDLLRGSLVYMHGAIVGPDALALGRRTSSHLAAADHPAEVRVAMHLAVANLGLAARRPDWIAEHADAAVAILRGDAEDARALAAALVLASWMTALRDVDQALAMLDEAYEVAEAAGAPAVADTALGYRANHLALAGRTQETHEVLDVLFDRGGERYTYGYHLWLHVTQAVNIVDDPRAAMAAGLRLDELQTRSHGLLLAAATAATGDVGRALRMWDETLESVDQLFVDDGLPDLLIAPAALAFGVGQHDRCRTLITAIRRFGRPTNNFLVTIMYRQLRSAVGLCDDNPLDRVSAHELLAEADAWMRSLARAGP